MNPKFLGSVLAVVAAGCVIAFGGQQLYTSLYHVALRDAGVDPEVMDACAECDPTAGLGDIQQLTGMVRDAKEQGMPPDLAHLSLIGFCTEGVRKSSGRTQEACKRCADRIIAFVYGDS